MKIKNPHHLLEKANSFRKSRILLTAVELDIFSKLDGNHLTASELAEKIACDTRALERVMSVLVNLGLINKESEKYSNTDLSSKYLVRGKEDFLSNLDHTNDLWNTWSDLTKVVKTGKSHTEPDINKRGDKWLEAFIEAMHFRGLSQFREAIPLMNLDNPKSSLDVGGGSGAFVIELTKVYPELKSVIFDLPNVIPLTKKYIEAAGISSNVSYQSGNYLHDDFQGKFDLIFLSAIIHINSYEENKKLIKKAASSLNYRGKVIIRDYIMDNDRLNPENGSLFAVNMLVGTAKGDTYTRDEIESWFRNAGLKNIDFVETESGNSLAIAEK